MDSLKDNKFKLLEYFAQFCEIPEYEKELYLKAGTLSTCHAKQKIHFQGDTCQNVFYIVHGLVRYYTIDNEGNELTISFRSDNEFVTDYQSFLTNSPSDFNIEALEDTICLKIDRFAIQELYLKSSVGNLIGRRMAENLFIFFHEQLISLYKLSAEERFAHFIENRGDVYNRIPQAHLASFIGVKPQSLSRIKKRYFMRKK